MFFRVMLFVWQFVLDLVAVMRLTDGFSRRFGAIEIREGAKRGAEADQNWRAHT